MSKNIAFLSLLPFVVSSIVACRNSECSNTNPVFDRYPPESEEYKEELIKQLDKQSLTELSYWFNGYSEKEGKEYISVHIKGDSICANAWILVDDWRKINNIKKAKGLSYHGAELVGLKFEIRKDTAKTEFVYKDIRKIVD